MVIEAFASLAACLDRLVFVVVVVVLLFLFVFVTLR
jgi:hypothetical protein